MAEGSSDRKFTEEPCGSGMGMGMGMYDMDDMDMDRKSKLIPGKSSPIGHREPAANQSGSKDDDLEVNTDSRFVKAEDLDRLNCFNNDTKNYLKGLSDFAYHHQGIGYHVQYFVTQEVLTDSDSYFCSDKEQLKKELIYLAFTEENAAKAVEKISENILKSQNAGYWANCYIEKTLFYVQGNPYRYKTACQDIWFDHGVWFDDETTVRMINVKKKGIRTADFFDLGFKYFFHGTDWASVDDIIKNGIVLNGSDIGQDFSFRNDPGYYVYDNFDKAKEWAESTTVCPAVIIFKVSNEVFRDREAHVKLTNPEEQESERVYRYHRSAGKDEVEVLKDRENWKTIEGPMLLNPGNQSLEFSSYKQMCIVDEDVAKVFHSSIQKVAYYGDRRCKQDGGTE